MFDQTVYEHCDHRDQANLLALVLFLGRPQYQSALFTLSHHRNQERKTLTLNFNLMTGNRKLST